MLKIFHLSVVPELSPEIYGLNATDSSKISVKNVLFNPPSDVMSVSEITSYLHELYCGHIGVEYHHVEVVTFAC